MKSLRLMTAFALLMLMSSATPAHADDDPHDWQFNVMANLVGLTIDCTDGSSNYGLLPGVGFGWSKPDLNAPFGTSLISLHLLVNLEVQSQGDSTKSAKADNWKFNALAVVGAFDLIRIGLGAQFSKGEAVHPIVMLSVAPKITR